MKRSSLGIICLALVCLIVFSAEVVSAAEANNPVLQILLADHKSVQNISIQHIEQWDKNPWGSSASDHNATYFQTRYCRTDVKPTKDGSLVTINDINWNISNRHLAIVADNTLYIVKSINDTQIGKPIVLRKDASYSEITIGSLAGQTSYTQGNITLYSDMDIPSSLGIAKPLSFDLGSFYKANPIYIPSGKYDIRINAFDSNSIYQIHKPDMTFNPGKTTIDIKKEELDNVSVAIKDSSNFKPYLSGWQFSPIYSSFNKLVEYMHVSDYNPKLRYSIFYSKGFQPEQDIELQAFAKGLVVYQTPAEIKSGSSVTLGTNLSLKTNLKSEAYKAGEVLSFNEAIYITDDYNNKVVGLENYAAIEQGTIITVILSKGNERYVQEMQIRRRSNWAEINVPNTSGIFDLSISIKGTPVTIKPFNTKITIQK